LQSLREGDGSKQDEYAALKKEAARVKKQLLDGEGLVEVSECPELYGAHLRDRST